MSRAPDRGPVRVRHSRRMDDAELVFTAAEWEAFVRGVKNDEFDVD